MIKTKPIKKDIKFCLLAAVILLLQVFFSIPQSSAVHTTAAESSEPELPPLSFSYQEARGDIPEGYYVYGVSDEWLLYSPISKPEIIITIPAEYDDIDEKNNYIDEDEDDDYEREFHGKAPVVAIADFAFAEGPATDFRVVGIDFSKAVNLQYIGIHSFANNIITDLDLTPCNNLKEIWWGAFSESARLRTVQLPGNVSMADGIFEDCGSLEYIMTQNEDDYAQYATMVEMESIAHLLTYEMDVTFDLGAEQSIKLTKLFNLPLSYTKSAGKWHKTSESLPDAGLKTSQFGMFMGSTDGTIINEESLANDSQYQITWITATKLEVVTNFPSGFSTDKSQKSDSLRQYLTVKVYGGDNNEYSREITDYSLTFIDGNYDQMRVHVDKLEMKIDFIVPITPKDNTYIWIIVVSIIILILAAIFVIFIKRKKIITEMVTETVTNTIVVVKEVSAVKRPLPNDLSDQERRVAELILKGKSLREISVELSISQGAVATYATRIYIKAGVEGQKEFMTYYLGNNG